MTKTLSELIAILPDVVSVSGDVDISITSAVSETDAFIEPGGLFVARRGFSVDGHDFIENAVRRGAAAIVGEREIFDLPVPYVQVSDARLALGWLSAAYHDFPSRKMTIIGVTGTDGKTTTTTLIHSILQAATEGKAGMISTVAAVLGDDWIDTGLHVTTPSAPLIQSLLALMVENGLTHCVLEMTSHGLAQGRLIGVDIDVAVLTNVTHEHLDFHGSWENYLAAKGILFDMLSNSFRKDKQEKISVINADDPSAEYFAQFPADIVLGYGLGEWANVRSQYVQYTPQGARFDVWNSGLSDGFFTLNLAGEFNILNALAAFTVARSIGINSSHIWQGLAQVESIPGRMELINEGQNFTAIVDFAHTPNALKSALEAARPMLGSGGRVIAVFGSAGLRDREKRRLMAETSIQLADFSIFTAEDPRTESLDDILQTMAAAAVTVGGVEGQNFGRISDRGEAIFEAIQLARAGDVVIACGKGHEKSMAFGTTEYTWDDREAMRAALRGAPLRTLPTASQG